ncbi:MAG TPA: hypothetical protein VK619_13070 [Pyrinomonadaceae bacterium]|nr:hypothetical protein [Pyrinomonadaceae bacterium]
MKFSPVLPVLLAFLTIGTASAQTPEPQGTPLTRPRTVTVIPPPSQQPTQQRPTPAPPAIVIPPITRQSTSPSSTQNARPNSLTPPEAPSLLSTLQPARALPPDRIRARIIEAERLLKARPTPTAMTTTIPSTDFVTLAALDQDSSQIHLLTVPKTVYLVKGAGMTLTSSLGVTLQLRVVRVNGVNTAVTVSDNAGRQLMPLIVEFPIERGGVYRETAYYTSAHPALLSQELVRAGQTYIHNMLDLAAKRLRDRGVPVSPVIIDIAERLCVVEHVDHERFRMENRIALYEEIYSLYALNELNTYRYAVSFAGAGGMVQMIPSTYQMIRRLHPAANLNPDFLSGMRNHANALEAMLLYMSDTWSDLMQNADVVAAYQSGLATQAELMAAGYNSNPARLGLYLNRGGSEWRTLIPRETQTYLQIYRNLEALIQTKPRTQMIVN